SRSPPSPPATSAPTSPSGTGQTQPPNDCSQHSVLTRSPNRRPRPDIADRRRRVNPKIPRNAVLTDPDQSPGSPVEGNAFGYRASRRKASSRKAAGAGPVSSTPARVPA